MSSPSSKANRPQGPHQAPRRGGRVLTGRQIHVEGERRTDLDIHHLARALLRLAQEHYDASEQSNPPTAMKASDKAPVAPHVARTGSNGPPRGPSPKDASTAPPARHEGATR
jgi:hypothetical protein